MICLCEVYIVNMFILTSNLSGFVVVLSDSESFESII